jgi:diaminohydroxyphosphoribosylaminopyrimidine deaminase/5-amino-6-(5-phosphoribosylamino)uracil reductase
VAQAGVRRVVAAMRDPNRLVNGRGLRALRRAGVAVDTGTLEAEARLLNEPFVASASTRRPFVLLKAALTLDGRIATASGRSRWITGIAARRQARQLRRLHDAVLVGIGTVTSDDPLLLPQPETRRAFTRVVLDTELRLPVASRLVGSCVPRTPVLVLCAAAPPGRLRALEARGVTVVDVAGAGGRVEPAAALDALFERGLTSVMVEGGSEVLGSFLAARLVDEIALFRAPLLLGGRGSLGAFGGPDPGDIGDALRLEPVPEPPAFSWPWRGPALFERWRPRR